MFNKKNRDVKRIKSNQGSTRGLNRRRAAFRRRLSQVMNVEALEDRVVLTASATDFSLVFGEDTAAVKSTKLSSDLYRIMTEYQSFQEGTVENTAATNVAFASANPNLQVVGDNVLVDAVAQGETTVLRDDLISIGATILGEYGRMVSALIPLGALPGVSSFTSLNSMRATQGLSNAGLVTSQGDAAMQSDVVKTFLGLDGTGVNVGVLSDSFNCLGGAATDVTNGDLSPVTVLMEEPSCVSGSDEGRAMLQLVHDVAPGAGLSFATAFAGEATFAANIGALATAGADVIVDDVVYFAEPFFQDGVVAQAVDAVVASGVPYYSSAINSGRDSYESGFVDSGSTVNYGFGSVPMHDFDSGAGTDFTQRFSIPVGTGMTMAFQWSDPFFSVSGAPGAATDLDVLLVNKTFSTVLAGSVNANVGNDPVEVFSFFNNGTIDADGDTIADTDFDLVIANFSGSDPSLMKYVLFRFGGTIAEYDTASGTSFGHANAAGASSVGAAPYFLTPEFGTDPPVLEPFSSAGGVPILFDTAGSLIGPVIRQTPDIVAPDGTDTTFFGSDIEPNGFPNFFGTSAAAPHAAAVAALMLQANPILTPAGVNSALESTAIDMGPTGYDFDSGWGLIKAPDAIASVAGPFAVTFDGTGGDDDMLVRLDASGNVEFLIGGTLQFELPLSEVASITASGDAGDDSLTVDFSNGNPIPSGGLSFDGAGQATSTGDSLTITGNATPFTSQAITFTNNGPNGFDGSMNLDGSMITFTGLEPINAGTAANTILNLPAAVANTDAVLQNNATAGMIEIVGTTFENTIIPNPTNSLTVNLGDTGDSLSVRGLDPAYNADLTINGGAGTDTVTFDTNVTDIGTKNLVIPSGTVEDINVNQRVITDGGLIQFNVGNDILFSSAGELRSTPTTGGSVDILAGNEVNMSNGSDVVVTANGIITVIALAGDIRLSNLQGGNSSLARVTAIGGAIIDNRNGESANVTATNVALRAWTGIGDASVDNDDIDVAATNLAAATATGDISIQDGNGVNVETVDSLVGVEITTGGAGDEILLRTNNNGLQLNDPVTNAGTGAITLAARGNTADDVDDLRIGANVTANGGTVTLIAHDDIDFTSTTAVVSSTTGATIDVMAGRQHVFGGAPTLGLADADITMADGSLVNATGGGQVTVAATRNVLLSNLSASGSGNTVIVTADSDSNNTGRITDNTAAEGANVIANQVALRAAEGIGDAAVDDADINLAVNLVAATTGTGDISLRDTNRLDIATVNALSGLGITTGGVGDDILVRVNNNDLNIDEAVTNSGTGAITLASIGNNEADDLLVGANVTASGGNVALVSFDDVTFDSASAVVSTSAAGTLDVLAGRTYSFGGGITLGFGDGDVGMLDGSQVATAGGPVTVTATQDVFLSQVTSTGGTVIVTADSDGDSDGTISDNTAGETANVTGAEVALRAASGIGVADNINTSVSTLAAANTTFGNIDIGNSVGGLLTIGTVDGLSGVTNTAPVGTATVTNASPLNVATNVSAWGDVTLTAGDSASAGDDLTVNAGVSVNSLLGNVNLRAGDNVSLPAGTTVAAWGSINIDVDNPVVIAVDPDAGIGSNVNIGDANVLSSGATTNIIGGADDDDISLPTQFASVLDINGEGGDDSYFVQLGNVGALAVNVHNDLGEGTDDLTVNGTALDEEFDVNDAVTDQVLLVGTGEVVNSLSDLEEWTVDGQSGADIFHTEPSATTELFIQGRNPSTAPGDVLDLNLIGSTGTLYTPGPGPRDGAFSFTNREDVIYRNIETLQNVAILEFSSTLYEEAEGDVPHLRSDVTVVRSGDPNITADVQVNMSDNTAFNGQDYLENDAFLGFGVGVTSISVPFTILGDEIVELDEFLNLNLQNPGVSVALGPNAFGALAKIVNDESATVSINNVSKLEGNAGTTTFEFEAVLDKAVDVGVNAVALTTNGTATAGVDFHSLTNFPLIFSGTAAGETETISVDVIGDFDIEVNETFFVNLLNLAAGGRAVTFADDTGLGTIIDDDASGIVERRFDFGTSTSPVAPGYTQVTAMTAYPAAGSAGWTAGTLGQRDRGAPNELDRDFNFSGDATFQVDLPTGVYDVSLTLGDQVYGHDQQAVFVEGTQVATVTTSGGQFQTVSTTVTVNDGALQVRIADLGGTDPVAAITQLEVVTHQLSPVLSLDFGTAGSPVEPGYTRVTASTFYLGGGGLGWQVGTVIDRDRGGASDLDRDLNATNDAFFKADLPNGTYEVFVTLGDAGFAHDQQSVTLEGTQIAVVDSAAGSFETVNAVVTITDGVLDMRLRDLGGVDPNAAITHLEVIPTTPPTPPLFAFDFGTLTSPLEANYTRVTPLTTYAGGFGISSGAVSARDRAIGDAVKRDLLFGNDFTFKVDLSNGLYDISVDVGDALYGHDFDVLLEGTLMESLVLMGGTPQTRTYSGISVTDGVLDLRLVDSGASGDNNAAINGLRITPVAGPDSRTIEPDALDEALATLWD
ncbi:MAG: Calx-beta domain-containing protein [Pirellulaceae bacterium]